MPAVEKQWGYDFGVDGVMRFETAAAKLDCSVDSIERYAARGELRIGTQKGHLRRGPRVVCIRSLNEYLRSIETKVAN